MRRTGNSPLLPPITYRAPNAEQTGGTSDIGVITISARRIVLLTVSYVPPGQDR